MTKLKFCGNKTFEEFKLSIESKAEYIGLIFAKSRRQVKTEIVRSWLEKVNIGSKKLVGVFVNQDINEILYIANSLSLSIIQLHGDETPSYVEKLKEKTNKYIWKVFHPSPSFQVKNLLAYEGLIDGIVIDSKVGVQYGGTGITFDWSQIPKFKRFAERLSVPCFIAGGINLSNVHELLTYKVDGIDISSGIESDFSKSELLMRRMEKMVLTTNSKPDFFGRFGEFGGKYVPETLMAPLEEIERGLNDALIDPQFLEELLFHLQQFSGRPTALTFAENLTKKLGGAKIHFKREDLNHTGAHKINNAIGQALLAKRLGKKKIIAETGAGQHGVAAATVAAKFGLSCKVFMGEEDIERQQLNVFRMKLLGAEVVPVQSGNKTLKDATNEAIRYWVQHCEEHFYMIGSVVGPHPYPYMVREFQKIIGEETKKQFLAREGTLPTQVIACVGGGSNAIGMFHPFVEDNVELIGVEAAGKGTETTLHAATLTKGSKGIIHGSFTYLLQDVDGQIQEPYSISAGLDYPGIGPEHAFLKDSERVKYESITDDEALEAFVLVSQTEGIVPAIETAHALALAIKNAPNMQQEESIVVCMSGRGDKDVQTLLPILESRYLS